MTIPESLGPVTRLPLRGSGGATGIGTVSAHVPASGGGGSPPGGSKYLNFVIRKQEQPLWCWAAVSACTAAFYNSATGWTQCLIANRVVGRSDCCTDGSLCNREDYLETALHVTRNFVAIHARPFSFADIQAELGRDRPLGCRIEWDGDGGGHFVALTGWRTGISGDEYVTVDDPIYLASEASFAQFASAYQTGATWTHTYETQPEPAIGGAMAAASGLPPVSRPEAIGA